MFGEKNIKIYKNTHAPDRLKTRIESTLSQRKKKRNFVRTYRLIPIVAMFFALAVLISVYSMAKPDDEVFLSYNGADISYDSVTLAPPEAVPMVLSMRSFEPYGIDFEIRSEDSFTVSVSDGEFAVFDKDSGEVVFAGGEYSSDENTAIRWNVGLYEKDEYVLTLISDGKEYVYILTSDPETNKYTISRKAV